MSLLGLGGPNESTKEKGEKENEFKMTKEKETRQERVENVGMVMGEGRAMGDSGRGEKRRESSSSGSGRLAPAFEITVGRSRSGGGVYDR